MKHSPQTLRTGWRSDAEGLRGIAILAVLIFHALPSWLPGGFVGVDLFFVLSGFLVGNLIFSDLAKGNFSYRTFYARRARRLFPALLVVLVCSLVAAPFIVGSDDYKELGLQAAASALFLANLLAWAQSGYFDLEAAYKPLLHLWSLGVEEQFYLMFPFALAFAWRHAFRNVGRLMSFATAISFAGCIVVTHWDGNVAFYFPLTRLWEFLAGAKLALPEHDGMSKYACRNTPYLKSNAGALAGLLLLAGSFGLVPEGPSFPGWHAALPVAGTLLLLAAGPEVWINRVVLSWTFFRWMGKVSYASYLWHWPILVFARYYTGGGLDPLPAVSLTALAVILAAISTDYVEAPFRTGQWSRRPHTARALWFSTAMVGACAIPLTTLVNARTPPELAKLESYSPPDQDIWREGKNCFVNLNNESTFGPECLGGTNNGQPLAVIWGDSHAAHLWPGLAKEASKNRWRLAQLTISQCTPLIHPVGEQNSKCPAMRSEALRTIKSLRPDTVILAGRWTLYDKGAVLSEILPTAQILKSIGVRRIIFVGPVPRWIPTLAKALAHDMRKQRLSEPPLNTSTGLEQEVFAMNDELKMAVEDAGAFFVSPISTLCDEKRKCKAWVDDDRKTVLMAFDGAHLTPPGSEWLAGRIAGQVLPPTGRQ